MDKPKYGSALYGHYFLFTLDHKDNIVQASERHNLITNQGLNNYGLLSLNNLIYECRVGVSNTPESLNQTNVLSEIARRNIVHARQVSSSFGSDEFLTQWYFPVGALDDVDVAEVGVMSNNNQLFSRTVLRTPQGTVEPHHVYADQRLFVSYKLTLQYPVLTSRTTVNVAGLGNYDATIIPAGRILDVGHTFNLTGLYGAEVSSTNELIVISKPSYTLTPDSFSLAGLVEGTDYEIVQGGVAPAVYVTGTFNRTKVATIDGSQGLSGIKALVVRQGNSTPYAIVFDNVIPKTDEYRLHFDFEVGWA